jgi:flagellar basal body-associated protein FliL
MSGINESQNSQLLQEQTKSVENLLPSEGSKRSITTYIFIGLCIFIVILAVYYAYGRFYASNDDEHSEESSDKKDKKDKSKSLSDEMVIDYNLAETIDALEQKQRQILQRLTSDVGI